MLLGLPDQRKNERSGVLYSMGQLATATSSGGRELNLRRGPLKLRLLHAGGDSCFSSLAELARVAKPGCSLGYFCGRKSIDNH